MASWQQNCLLMSLNMKVEETGTKLNPPSKPKGRASDFFGGGRVIVEGLGATSDWASADEMQGESSRKKVLDLDKMR